MGPTQPHSAATEGRVYAFGTVLIWHEQRQPSGLEGIDGNHVCRQSQGGSRASAPWGTAAGGEGGTADGHSRVETWWDFPQ